MKGIDNTHPTVYALEQLVPKATVFGGSFASQLPESAPFDAAARANILREARVSVVEEVLAELAYRTTGHKLLIPRSSTGSRAWPKGFVGSVTHKGTVVLAAMASAKVMSALGIDLEKHRKGLPGFQDSVVRWIRRHVGLDR